MHHTREYERISVICSTLFMLLYILVLLLVAVLVNFMKELSSLSVAHVALELYNRHKINKTSTINTYSSSYAWTVYDCLPNAPLKLHKFFCVSVRLTNSAKTT